MADSEKVGQGKVVSIHFKVTDEEGDLVESTEGGQPLDYLHGCGQLAPGLEKALEGKVKGDHQLVTVEPKDGYGESDPGRMLQVSRDNFDFDPEAGDIIHVLLSDGVEVPVLIREVGDELVTLDGNHPLAGKTLHFDVTVVGIRVASQEELEHGHSH
ncbi:MAG: peptidylprolyl isomerase [Bradymonadales bacterium]|nr:peptidylprolyl isomerase [Bradymonadales bacterium]